MFPETAGKTLEEVENMFTDPNGPRYIGTLAWKTKITTKRALMLEHGGSDPEKMAVQHEESPERSEYEIKSTS